MATVILRPTADVSREHTCKSGFSGYLNINEATADDDSTYIYQTVTDSGGTNCVSTFTLTPAQDIASKFTINSWTIYIRHKVTSTDAQLKTCIPKLIIGENSTTLSSQIMSTEYTTQSSVYSVSDGGEFTNISALGTISATVQTVGGKKKAKDDDFQLRITQLYVVLDYEPVSDTSGTGIYLKQNGAYTQAQAAYKKVNGVWVQQTDTAALKTEIQTGRYKYGG